MASDLVRLVRRLVRETRKGGVPTSHEIASSDTFFDDFERRAVRAERQYRAKFGKMKIEIERALGPAEVRATDSENVEALWQVGGTAVRLVLSHEDKEMPFVLTVSAEHDGPLLRNVATPEPCECATLKTTKDPFCGKDLVLVKNNPAIKKTHVRLAENKVDETTIRLFQCRGCKRFRQSGDAGLQYVFEVPPIDVEEWKREPYVDYSRLKMYEWTLEFWSKAADERPPTKKRCSRNGCRAMALRDWRLCREHQLEEKVHMPTGRPLS